MLVFVWAILSPIRINQLSSPDRFCVFGYGDDGDALAALPNVKITTTTKHGTAMMYPWATTPPPLPALPVPIEVCCFDARIYASFFF